MKILHVLNKYRNIGGIQRYVEDLTSHFRKRGWWIDVLAVGQSRRYVIEREANGEIHLLPRLFSVESACVSHYMIRALNMLATRADVIHFHYPNPVGELAYLVDSRARQKPSIVTYHGEIVPGKRLYCLYRPIAEQFLYCADSVVATSPQMVQNSKILQRIRGKTHVVPLGIYAPKPVSHCAPDIYPKGVFPRILYVGRLSRYKGLKYLIDAIAKVRGYVILAGDGPLRDELVDRARQRGVEDRVTFTGFVTNEMLWRLYDAADIFVLPSTDRGEGFGYVLLEAMVKRTAVISTELGTGTSYANQHGKTGFVVEPGNAEALAGAIEDLARERTRLEAFKDAARERVVKEFTFDRMAAGIEREYVALLGKNND